MAKYNTEQRGELLSFLSAHSDSAFTVSEITDCMRSDRSFKKPPAESTVYRLIKELVGEGRVKRTVSGCSREFRYQLAGQEDCGGHLHMKCSVCGELLHMQHESSEHLAERLLEEEGFSLDTGMVLTGVCNKCRS
ncbi:MAG: transcriptional repressor [Ruminococcus sp.]|nr:transcriptional repressor [Ruminococcus sp.]